MLGKNLGWKKCQELDILYAIKRICESILNIFSAKVCVMKENNVINRNCCIYVQIQHFVGL